MKRGVALLWVLVLTIVLLIISGTMVTYIIKESRSSVRIEESSKAYSAAKSGVDWALWKKGNNPPLPNCSNPAILNIDTESIAQVCESGGGVNALIESTGIVGTVRRKIEYKPSNYSRGALPINPANIELTQMPGTNSGSFVYLFDFWISDTSQPWKFGLSTQAKDKYIALSHTGGGNLQLEVTGVPASASKNISDFLPSRDAATTNETMVRAEIRYIEGTAASIRFLSNIPNVECLDSLTVPIEDELGDLKYVYAYSSSGSYSYNNPYVVLSVVPGTPMSSFGNLAGVSF